MAKRIERPTAGAAALWRWIQQGGMNQRRAAELLGMHFQTLNQILKGRRRPGLFVAERIEQVTGIDCALWLRAERSAVVKRAEAGAAR
jgi:transcriptional regulator with XRE-family HTH domain